MAALGKLKTPSFNFPSAVKTGPRAEHQACFKDMSVPGRDRSGLGPGPRPEHDLI